jgi:RNA polymerase sigma-70 factor (ECF subfamily)
MAEEVDVTQLLQRFDSGDAAVRTQIFGVVYGELHRIAHRYIRKEREGHTLQTTGLVHEAYIKLVGQKDVDWQSRAHFYGVAAKVMRRILVDYARARNAGKRGGGLAPLPLDEGLVFSPQRTEELLDLDEMLSRLEDQDPDVFKVIELRVFVGLTVPETAKTLDLGERTVKRRWQFGRAWLHAEMMDKHGGKSGTAGAP